MKIRTRLNIQFALIVASILLFFSLAVYFLFSNFREQDFYGRLRDRAITTSKILTQIKQVSFELQKLIDRSMSYSLTNEKVDVYNDANRKIYSSSDTGNITVTLLLLNRIRTEKEVKFKEGNDEVIGISVFDKPNSYVVLASAYDKYGYNKLRFLRIILIILFFISMIIIVIGGWIFSRGALLPISRVISEVDNISVSNLNAKVNEGNGKDEIALLAVTFNKMLRRLKSSFELQKNFVSNASHELRTPLTVLTGQIGVALQKERTAEEYKKLLQSLSDDIRNMNNLTNRLLDLATASRDVTELNFREVLMDEIILNARAEVVKRNPEYKVFVHFEDLPEYETKFSVRANEELLRTAFINLMDNACKFSPLKKADISISIGWDNFKLLFKDDGIGIPEQEMKMIFEPLYRSTNAKEFKGHGLGLALTQKIIQLHGGTLSIESAEGQGTSIEIFLPRNLPLAPSLK